MEESLEKLALEQLKAAIERGDLEEAHEILDAKESAENPNLLRIEFTKKQLKFIDEVRADTGNHMSREMVIINAIDMMIAPYQAEKKRKQEAARR